ncbi:MAG TPA: PP2C family protein-serine/threonine phosphatase, partial [Burkholderiales bacterium]|nr:PP2C family protein-serine/threonine phosphatase [Burkholderiales bacterium]
MNLLDTEGDLARRLAEERENALVAQRVMDQMAGMEAQPLAEVQKAVAAASGFSGDRLVGERTPAGVLHVFLADGVGHGLVPALLALPLTQLFSAMSRKGFHLSAIVGELNRKISQYRLPGQFVAVTLAAYDPLTGYLEVWNGGNPDGLLLDADGTLLRRFASTHLPLGVASGAELDTRTEGMLVPDGAQLLLYSDGLVEAEGERIGEDEDAGARFGEQRLLACAAAHAPAARLEAILAAVKAHLAGRDAHDDISLLALACARQAR